jgi:tryptophan synthase alpha chain
MSRITQMFESLGQTGQKALMPYLTLGYPKRDSALELVPALVEGGADMIELGVPYSDPLADGATIQAASQQALENGMTLALCLEQVSALRAQGIEVPMVLMGYYNPILQIGVQRFAEQAHAAGADGAIVPDLPPEEADNLQESLRALGMDLIFLLAPTSGDERLREIAARASGFLYLVSLVGVTGARDRLPVGLEAFCARVRAAGARAQNPLPQAVGFGIGTPEQARRVATVADGVIVGSALIRTLGAAATRGPDLATAAREFVAALRTGIDTA